ncbi:hypothetical protein WME98_04650 [Sorangium sp. So ce296]|uniref:hypothetical protein n=1 Tax=Sorangium sp. So ce296 TaxID=3133296 RepID=UPI003F62835E
MRSRRTRWLLRSLGALALAGLAGTLGAGGCGDDDWPSCGQLWNPCPVVNPDGTSNGVCWGKCVPRVGLPSFSDPLLFWIGPEESEPSCEDLVADDPRTGEPQSFVPYTYARLRSVEPGQKVCGNCVCDRGACGLPRTVAANSSSSCQQTPEATNTPFNPPRNWDGRCTSPGTVPSSQVGSIWIGPISESSCEPRVQDAPPVPEGPSQVAVACLGGVIDNYCPNFVDSCMLNQQEAHVSPEWRYCTVAEEPGVRNCEAPAAPGDPPQFSDRLLFYERDFSDPRNCAPCGCVTTTPGRCDARVSAYADRACSDSALLGTAEVAGGEGDACLYVERGPALGSLSAEWEVSELPGCTPFGGEPHPRTVCCLPEPEE